MTVEHNGDHFLTAHHLLKVSRRVHKRGTSGWAGPVWISREMSAMNQSPTSLGSERLGSEFIALVSRELRAPLTSIKGTLGLILGGSCGELNDELQALLSSAYASSERVVMLINDILELARFQAGQVSLHIVPVDLASIVERSVSEIASLAEQRGILVVTSLPMDLPQVQADRERIQQVLTNLVSNAVKFSPPDSSVVISATHQGDWVTVNVKGSSMGMTPQDQDRLFDTFQQLRSVADHKPATSGLGLSICKAIVEQHRGQIGVQSEPGQGGRFFFTLPAVPSNGASAESGLKWSKTAAVGTRGAVWSNSLVSEPPPPPFVLMVDDDPGLRRVVARIVQHSGRRVETADNGKEALEKIQALHPDLIILDVLMPLLSGFGVVQALRQQPEMRSIPLLVLTTKDLSEAEKEALRLGPTKFLAKSLVTVESLTAAMDELLQSERKPTSVLV